MLYIYIFKYFPLNFNLRQSILRHFYFKDNIVYILIYQYFCLYWLLLKFTWCIYPLHILISFLMLCISLQGLSLYMWMRLAPLLYPAIKYKYTAVYFCVSYFYCILLPHTISVVPTILVGSNTPFIIKQKRNSFYYSASFSYIGLWSFNLCMFIL